MDQAERTQGAADKSKKRAEAKIILGNDAPLTYVWLVLSGSPTDMKCKIASILYTVLTSSTPAPSAQQSMTAPSQPSEPAITVTAPLRDDAQKPAPPIKVTLLD